MRVVVPARKSDGVAFVEVMPGVVAAYYHGQLGPCTRDAHGYHVNREWLQMRKMIEAYEEAELRMSGNLPPVPQPRYRHRPRGADRMQVERLCRLEGPGVPREELPDELPALMAAGMAQVHLTTMCRLCRDGVVEARRDGPRHKWMVDTDSLITWLVATGRRENP